VNVFRGFCPGGASTAAAPLVWKMEHSSIT